MADLESFSIELTTYDLLRFYCLIHLFKPLQLNKKLVCYDTELVSVINYSRLICLGSRKPQVKQVFLIMKVFSYHTPLLNLYDYLFFFCAITVPMKKT